MPTTVECRSTEDDLLHGVVGRGYRTLQARLDATDRWLPRHVRREVRRYLSCGDPSAGFAWLTCTDCDHHRLVTFSCKGRGFCPRCAGRRMASRSARWVDALFPYVAVRQWVLTVPWRRRWELARHPGLVRGVGGVLQRELARFYRARCGSFAADEPSDDDDDDNVLPLLQGASVRGRLAATGRRVRRVQWLGGRPFELPPRCAS